MKNVKIELVRDTFQSVGSTTRSSLHKTVLELVIGGVEKLVGESTDVAVEGLVVDALESKLYES